MSFAVLSLICGVALIGPLLHLNRRIPIPVVIGELIVGILLGNSGLRILDPTNSTFSFMADMGFVLVMFVVGSHVPVRGPALRAGLARGSARAGAVGILAVVVGFVVARLFGTDHALLYAVLLTSSSAGVVLPALGGAPLTGQTMVQFLPQIALADAASIVLLPLAIEPARAGRAAIGAVAITATAAVAWLLMRWLQNSGRRKRIHQVSARDDLAIELRSVLAMTFGVAAVAVAFSVSVMLAGFVMGLAVAAVGEPRRVAKQLFALTEGFLSPVFFVWLGSSINLRELSSNPSAVVLGVALGVGAIGVHAAMVLTGQPFAAAASAGAQLGVPVAAAALGTTLGIFRPGEPAALLLGALVTIAVTTALSGRLTRIARCEAAPPAAASTGPREAPR